MKVSGTLAVVAMLGICSCQSPHTSTLQPQLVFRIDPESGNTAPRQLTIDPLGDIYIFDYDDYVIAKYHPDGSKILEFGGPADEPDGFQHLMAVRALGDSLLALDAGSLSAFERTGEMRWRRPFVEIIVADYPRIYRDGRWAAEWIIEETAEYTLTYRSADGSEIQRIASYLLSDIFPGVEPGEMFFINGTQAPKYLYDFLPDGRLVWMDSEELNVFVHEGREDQVLFRSEAHPVPYPQDEIDELEKKQDGLSPPLFLNVPTHYQIAQHLLVAGSGDIWLYIVSAERTGFLRLTSEGEETGFFELVADFDVLTAQMTIANGRMYFLVTETGETEVFYVDLPSN